MNLSVFHTEEQKESCKSLLTIPRNVPETNKFAWEEGSGSLTVTVAQQSPRNGCTVSDWCNPMKLVSILFDRWQQSIICLSQEPREVQACADCFGNLLGMDFGNSDHMAEEPWYHGELL